MDLTRTAFYDEDQKTLWVTRRFFQPRSRVSRDEVMHWVQFLQDEARTEDGRPVEQVNYLFVDEETAAYNYQTLSFARIGVFYKDGGNRIPYVPEDGPQQYDVRSDFGLEVPPGSGVREEE